MAECKCERMLLKGTLYLPEMKLLPVCCWPGEIYNDKLILHPDVEPRPDENTLKLLLHVRWNFNWIQIDCFVFLFIFFAKLSSKPMLNESKCWDFFFIKLYLLYISSKLLTLSTVLRGLRWSFEVLFILLPSTRVSLAALLSEPVCEVHLAKWQAGRLKAIIAFNLSLWLFSQSLASIPNSRLESMKQKPRKCYQSPWTNMLFPVSTVSEDLLINNRETDPALLFAFYSVRRYLIQHKGLRQETWLTCS